MFFKNACNNFSHLISVKDSLNQELRLAVKA